jgi:two-component system LytT family response regulator
LTLRVLLVDDEAIARRGLRQRLLGESDFEVVGEAEDVPSAVAALGELAPDLVFLDIQMPGGSGFDVIDAVGLDHMPATVFVTAFDEFALRAFDVHALDYVLKPIDGVRFRDTLGHLRSRLAPPPPADAGEFTRRVAAALSELGVAASRRWSKRLAVHANGRVALIAAHDVDHLESAGNYVEIHVGDRKRLLRETLTSLEARLDPEIFVRVSRSALVNLDRVAGFRPVFNGDFVVVLKDGREIAGSRRHREEFERRLA